MAETDATAFVAAQVHDDARALLGDELHRGVELQAAVAAHRTEHVAGEALGVHAHEHVLLARDLALHERHVLGAVEQRLEHEAGEVAVTGRDARLGHPAHQLLGVPSVADEVGDGDELEAVLLGELLEARHARHAAVVVHDFGEHAGGVHAREASEVDRGLGVAGALEHSSIPIPQREDVTGASEVFGPGGGIEQCVHGRAAVGGRDAGGRALPGVDRHRERGALALGVVGDHEREAQLVEARPLDRHADHAARVADHERHLLGRHGFGGHDQVALVLAVGVVDDDHDLTACDGGDGVLDLGEGHLILPG